MVAEVVLSVMGNRSDRRLANLSNSRALEAVVPIRTRCADFHQGPERQTKLLTEAEYTTATGFAFTPANGFALRAGSIYESSNPLPSANESGMSAILRRAAEARRCTHTKQRSVQTLAAWARTAPRDAVQGER